MTSFKRLSTAALLAFGLGALSLLTPIGHTIAQGVIGVFQNGQPLSPSVYGVGDTSSGFYFGSGFASWTRHIASGSVGTNNLPVISNAGASPVLTAGSTDTAGRFLSTSGTTTATLTFGTAWTTVPSCILQEQGGSTAPTYTVSVTAITITVMVSATNYNYLCVGLSGG
jgi:hypothetical protein